MQQMHGSDEADVDDTTHTWSRRPRTWSADINELRDNIADFDDFFRPIRNYFYWEPHCFNIPVC